MKKNLLSVIVILLVLVCAVTCDARPRLAIRPFANKTTNPNIPADAITDMMTTELNKARIFSLMERERLDYIGEEIRLGQSGLMDPSTAPRVGKIKGAQYTMTGAVTVYHFNKSGGIAAVPGLAGGAAAKTAYVVIDLRIVNNETGEVEYAEVRQGSAKREAAGMAAAFPGFFVAGGSRSYGGILASATRDAVMQHVRALQEYTWYE